MLKLLLILFFVGLLAFGGYLLQAYDFPITAEFNSYLVETSMARLVIVLVFSFVILYGLVKLLFWLKNSPKRLLSKIRKENEQQGYRDIMNGFSALAAGSPERARKFASKADRALPGQSLVKLLQAQVAVAKNERTEAEGFYKELTLTEEGRFVGFRGLISQSITGNDSVKALKIADDLLRDNPKSEWLNEALIDLTFRTSDWEKLERYLKKAEANKALPKDKLKERFAVFYYLKAKIAQADGRVLDAEWLGERSLKYKPDFLPAGLFMAELYNMAEKYKKAKLLVEKFWPTQTHPRFMRAYETALLNTTGREKAKKVKKLYEKAPDDVESSAFYARILIEEHQSPEARTILSHGLKVRETKALCALMAEIDDRIAWEHRAENATGDKCWYCIVTGARYADWQPYSESGELNTIHWGFPPSTPKTALADNKFLYIG